ncbi:MAG: hypothetical protein WA476_19550 [Acidobacteriaceae bacterium]
MADSPKQSGSEKPAQIGTATAVSSSSDNLRAPETMVPASRQDAATPPSDAPTMVGTGPAAPGMGSQPGRGNSQTSGQNQPLGSLGQGGVDLEPGTILAGRYEILAVLGTGGWVRCTGRRTGSWIGWWR